MRLGSSRYMVKMRVFGGVGELEKLRNKLTRFEINAHLLKGELVVSLLTPSQVLGKGVYKAVFGR